MRRNKIIIYMCVFWLLSCSRVVKERLMVIQNILGELSRGDTVTLKPGSLTCFLLEPSLLRETAKRRRSSSLARTDCQRSMPVWQPWAWAVLGRWTQSLLALWQVQSRSQSLPLKMEQESEQHEGLHEKPHVHLGLWASQSVAAEHLVGLLTHLANII